MDSSLSSAGEKPKHSPEFRHHLFQGGLYAAVAE